MRKLMIVALVSLLCLGAALLVGCGGNVNQAQQYLQDADAQYQKLADDSNQLATKITSAFSNAADPGKLEAAVVGLNTFLDGMDKKADAAIAEYGKVKPLQGVPKYVKYADMQTELMALIKQATTNLKTMMTQVTSAVKAGDQALIQSLQSSFQPTFTELSKKISKLEEESAKFKAENNL
jgi:outer membrane murein-binding lipoprotein Lpp